MTATPILWVNRQTHNWLRRPWSAIYLKRYAPQRPMNSTKAHCNTCGGDRNHEVLHKATSSWECEEGYVSGGDSFETLQCRGCDRIHLRHTSWFSEVDEPKITYFPPPIFRKPPEWYEDLWLEIGAEYEFIGDLLQEVYIATQNNLPRLAAMGVRALLEQIMISRVGDLGSFRAHLDAFEDQGFVTVNQKKQLEAILDAGHAAAHRAYKPGGLILQTLLDLTEHIIESVFLHEDKIAHLRQTVPRRIAKDEA